MKHFNRNFDRTIINPLTKDGFSCVSKGNNKYLIRKDDGPQYLVHSGPPKKLHELRRFLKSNYSYELCL